MSIKVMSAVWENSKAAGTDLLVLLSLADMANDEGECWPSVRTIARKCRIDERTTQRRIRSLENLGEVMVIRGGGKASTSGGTKSNRYRIVVHISEADGGDVPGGGVADCQGWGGTGAGGGVARVPGGGVAPVPPESSVEPSIESSSSSEDDETISQAFGIIADQRIAATTSRILNPAAYKATTLKSVREEHLDRALGLLSEHPGIAPMQLAALLELEPAEDDTACMTRTFPSCPRCSESIGRHDAAISADDGQIHVDCQFSPSLQGVGS